MKIRRYCAAHQKEWDDYLHICKNKHFLFYRGFMDYHHDRFTDHSLIIADDENRLVSLFPANENGGSIYSHQGLTFGGLLYSNRIRTEQVIKIMDEVLAYYRALGFKSLFYKAIPWIYHLLPAEEDVFALSLQQATRWKIEVSSSLVSREQLRYSKGKKWSVNCAKKAGLSIGFCENYKDYWDLLSAVLMEKHGAKPVHSLAEITKLAEMFPTNIKLAVALHDQVVYAGAVLFISDKVAHFQYMANSAAGKECGALDAVIDFVIETYIDERIIDFGISTEDDGRVLNKGLIAQKEGFGSGAVVHRSYRIEI